VQALNILGKGGKARGRKKGGEKEEKKRRRKRKKEGGRGRRSLQITAL